MILALALTTGILSHADVNVVQVPDRNASEAHIRVVVYSGSAEDPPGLEGLAWATARAIRDRAGTGAPLEGMAVSVERDVTIFSATVGSAKLAPALDSLAMLFTGAIGEDADMDAIRAEREEPADDGVEIAFDAILFMEHPDAHPPAGSNTSLGRITGPDLARFHADHYRKGNLAFGIAGAVGAGSPERIRTALASLPDGEPSRERRQPSYPTVPRVFVIEAPGSDRALLRLGQPVTVTRAHPDHPALLLAARCLDASGPAAVGLGSDRFGRRLGAFRMAIETAPASAAQAARDALGALGAAVGGGLDADCLAEAASGLAESVRDLTPAEDLDLRLSEFLHGDGGHAERLAAAAAGPGPETVKEALSRHLSPGRLTLVAIVPDAGAFIGQLESTSIGGRALRSSDFEITSLERALGGY